MQFKVLERELSQVAGNQIDKTRFDNLMLQVANLAEGQQELEDRLEVLENHDAIGLWVFRLVVGIATALTIGWLSGLIG